MALDPKNPIYVCANCGWSGTAEEMLFPLYHIRENRCPKCKQMFLTYKPKMLFVDDRTKRIHYALDVYGKEYDVTIAACVPEALRLLSSQDWAIVDLDHDLMGHDFEDPDTPTCGMEIVRYIRKCGGWPEEHFGTHYNNPVKRLILLITSDF